MSVRAFAVLLPILTLQVISLPLVSREDSQALFSFQFCAPLAIRTGNRNLLLWSSTQTRQCFFSCPDSQQQQHLCNASYQDSTSYTATPLQGAVDRKIVKSPTSSTGFIHQFYRGHFAFYFFWVATLVFPWFLGFSDGSGLGVSFGL